MKLAVLFSGGKDSTYALYKAMQKENVVCLISIISKNKESYMFHTPNINITEVQAEALGLPIIVKKTTGKKEEELKDLKKAIKEAVEKYKIEGVVTGAVGSVYQAARIETICDELNLFCFNPLWLKDQIELLKELVENKFEVIISGISAYPFDYKWLGRIIDEKTIEELIRLNEKFKVQISGEGGEYESTVLNCPIFKKKINITKSSFVYQSYSGVYNIDGAELIKK